MSNALSLSLLSAMALDASNKAAAAAARDTIKASGLWASGVDAFEASAADTLAAFSMATEEAAEIIKAAAAADAADYIIAGIAFPLTRDKKGAIKPVSKQRAYMRLSDVAGIFSGINELPEVFRPAFRNDNDVIIGEVTFKAAAAAAKENARLASLSPFRRMLEEEKALIEAAEKAAALVGEAAAALAAAEKAAAAAIVDHADKAAQIAAAEHVVMSAQQANGRINPNAVKEAERKAAEAEAKAAEAAAAREAAEAAAAAAEKRASEAAAAAAEGVKAAKGRRTKEAAAA